MNFEFVDIPEEILPVIGQVDPGTRIYRQTGSENHIAEWFESLSKQYGQLVSPGGVCMFAPVTRAAVHKRLKEGRLTIFCYHPEVTKRGLFGNRKKVRQTPYVYIPVSEAMCWRNEIEERMQRKGALTKEELEGDRPDWDGDFLD